MPDWCLERVVTSAEDPLIPLESFPFLIGREGGCDLVINSSQTSRHHARIEQTAEGHLDVVDLGSGNGTYVNREAIAVPTRLASGDVLHFGGTEFRLRRVEEDVAYQLAQQNSDKTVLFSGSSPKLSGHFVVEEALFGHLLHTQSVRLELQPIVSVSNGQLFAYEALGRGTLSSLPASPAALFSTAARLGKSVDLSEAFRNCLIRDANRLPASAVYFINSHPDEMFSERFYASLAALRAALPMAQLVVEVHETAVTHVDAVRDMAKRLTAMRIRFAYDDFGAGQARLLELAEVPPHFVKFDIGLIRGIDSANLVKRQLVAQLVKMVHDVGAITLAECVETEAEARTCVEFRFDLIQGLFTGKPMSPDAVWETQQSFVSTELQAIIHQK